MNNLVREKNPLVINITNIVTVNDIANMMITIGASPIMTTEIDESQDLLNIAKAVGGALVVNIGTINKSQKEHIFHAVKIANELGIKVILDPVGAGASEIRTNTSLQLLKDFKIDIIRGNFSEINSLYGSNEMTKGVDSADISDKDLALKFAKQFNVTTVISGKDDYISDGKSLKCIENKGSNLLPKISGTGCMLTAIIGAYAGVYNNFEACEKALNHLLTASERAEKSCNSTAEFRWNLFSEMEKYD